MDPKISKHCTAHLFAVLRVATEAGLITHLQEAQIHSILKKQKCHELIATQMGEYYQILLDEERACQN